MHSHVSFIDRTVMPGVSPPATPGPGIAPLPVSPEPVSVARTYGYDRTFFRRLYSLSKPTSRPQPLADTLRCERRDRCGFMNAPQSNLNGVLMPGSDLNLKSKPSVMRASTTWALNVHTPVLMSRTPYENAELFSS